MRCVYAAYMLHIPSLYLIDYQLFKNLFLLKIE